MSPVLVAVEKEVLNFNWSLTEISKWVRPPDFREAEQGAGEDEASLIDQTWISGLPL